MGAPSAEFSDRFPPMPDATAALVPSEPLRFRALTPRLLRALRVGLAPFAAPLWFLALGLLWLSAVRAALVFWQWPRLADVDGLARLFVIGARMDGVLLCYLLALPMLSQGLAPAVRLRRWFTATALTLAAVALVFMECVTPAFLQEYDRRPDRLFFEYLAYPHEVFSMLLKSHPLLTLGAPPFLLLLACGFWRFWNRWLRAAVHTPYGLQMAVFLPLVLGMFVAARGLDHRPLNLSHASFSPNRLANELAANSLFSVGSAAYASRKEADAASLYGSMPEAEILARVRKYMGLPASAYATPEIPTLHPQTAPSTRARPLNLVIILEESLGAGHVGRLGGLPLTPNLDRLSQQGHWFTRMYATGTRTARGMEAVVAGFPPTPAPAVLKLPRAQRGFFTLGELLKRQGYATEFIYGGVANFDNMRSFYLGNGFQRVIEQGDFKNPEFVGSWGVSDEDWVRKAHDTFRAHGDRPFFAVMMSTSNHEPFEIPAGRIEPYEQPLYTRYNAMKYADHALGRFFDLARKADYFRNTVFVIVADHEARVYGTELMPLKHFRVPALVLGPGIAATMDHRVVSQIDLAPSLLDAIGVSSQHPMVGRRLFEATDRGPDRALLQFDQNHGFRVGNRLVVHTPHAPAQTFAVGLNDRLTPMADDPELIRDALAHALWASRAYLQNQYRVPNR